MVHWAAVLAGLGGRSKGGLQAAAGQQYRPRMLLQLRPTTRLAASCRNIRVSAAASWGVLDLAPVLDSGTPCPERRRGRRNPFAPERCTTRTPPTRIRSRGGHASTLFGRANVDGSPPLERGARRHTVGVDAVPRMPRRDRCVPPVSVRNTDQECRLAKPAIVTMGDARVLPGSTEALRWRRRRRTVARCCAAMRCEAA